MTPQRKSLLLYNGACAFCVAVAEEVASKAPDRLEALPLSDPYVRGVLGELQRDDLFEPALVEFGSRGPRLVTGVKMRAHLARALGPGKSLALLEMLLQGVEPSDEGTTDARPRTGRRQFLGALGGGTAAGLALALGMAGTAAAATPDPVTGVDSSPHALAVESLKRSDEWAAMEATASAYGLHESRIVQVIQHEDRFFAIWAVSTGASSTALATIFLLDSPRHVRYARFSRVAAEDGTLRVVVTQLAGPVLTLEKTSSEVRVLAPAGRVLFSGRIGPEGNIEPASSRDATALSLAQRSTRPNAASPDLFGFNWCDWAVGVLCSTGGSVGCYGLCLALGLVSGPGAIGCGAACALIELFGCAAATYYICG